ncbi:MAG: hypothetical protein DYG89_28890 [Caldilinea sp. CFX5]|nr:hypothetical protein [Caldilinea sp. CFX5]
MPTLTISLLGGFSVTAAGEARTAFAYDKVRGLLAYLVVEADRPHRRDWLATLFWPDQARRSALQSLSQALYQLRRALGETAGATPYLLTTPQTVQFNTHSDFWVDLHEFTQRLDACTGHTHTHLYTCADCLARLAQAVALYRGHFLAGFSLADSPEFDEWTLLQRERFQRLALDALRTLTTAYERQGVYDQALRYGQQWLALDPWQEEAHRALMRLFAASGQRAAALTQFATCRRLLADEVGAEPAAETVALYQRIRDADGQPLSLATHHNLPSPATPLIGRRQELATIEQRLRDPACRLLSLVGAGGSGKSRLALEAAAHLAPEFADGIIFVPLAAVDAPVGLVPAIGQALGLAFARQEDPQRQLLTYLQAKNLLLVLDNFEHLLAGGPLLTQLLEAAAQVKILVTSRAQLNLQGEQMITIGGLALPDLSHANPPTVDAGAALAATDAVALFLYHARRLRPADEPTAADLAAIARICVGVDGIPLAILLAAAWLPVLTPTAIARQLLDEATQDEHGIDFLTADWPDLPARQRSMRTVLDQAWRLLREPEQRVLAALTVFRGGFTAPAAHAVTGAALRQLRTLLEKSWLHPGADNRYDMHELLRQYAREQQKQTPALALQVQDRHCTYFAAALAQWATELRGERQLHALRELETDLDNVRAAWQWALAQGEIEAIDQALEGIALFYDWRGHCQQGEALCQAAVARLRYHLAAEERTLLVRLLAWHARFSQLLTHRELAQSCLQEALALLDTFTESRQDVRHERAFTLYVAGQVAAQTDRNEAQRCWEASLALYRALADAWGATQLLNTLGRLALEMSDYATARRLLEESLAISQSLGDRKSMAHALCFLSNLYATQNEPATATALIDQSVIMSQALGDRLGAAESLGRMAGTLAYQGHFAESAALFAQSSAIYQEQGVRQAYALETHLLAWINVNLGHYEQARQLYRLAHLIWSEGDDRHGLALSELGLGEIALVEEDFAEALALFRKSAAHFAEVHQRDEEAIALADLGAALRGLGRRREARQAIAQALQITQDIGVFAAVLFAIEAYAFLLADEGEAARALELYTLIAQHPYVKASRLHQEQFERYIGPRIESLSTAEQEAAIRCGEQGNVPAAVNAILKEIQ